MVKTGASHQLREGHLKNRRFWPNQCGDAPTNHNPPLEQKRNRLPPGRPGCQNTRGGSHKDYRGEFGTWAKKPGTKMMWQKQKKEDPHAPQCGHMCPPPKPVLHMKKKKKGLHTIPEKRDFYLPTGRLSRRKEPSVQRPSPRV